MSLYLIYVNFNILPAACNHCEFTEFKTAAVSLYQHFSKIFHKRRALGEIIPQRFMHQIFSMATAHALYSAVRVFGSKTWLASQLALPSRKKKTLSLQRMYHCNIICYKTIPSVLTPFSIHSLLLKLPSPAKRSSDRSCP